MAELSLPRIICADCLKDVIVEHISGAALVRLECHGVEDLIYVGRFESFDFKKPVFLLSEFKDLVWSEGAYATEVNERLTWLRKAIDELGLVNRVRVSRNHSPIRIPATLVDRAIDTLLLFRDEKISEPPPIVEVP